MFGVCFGQLSSYESGHRPCIVRKNFINNLLNWLIKVKRGVVSKRREVEGNGWRQDWGPRGINRDDDSPKGDRCPVTSNLPPSSLCTPKRRVKERRYNETVPTREVSMSKIPPGRRYRGGEWLKVLIIKEEKREIQLPQVLYSGTLHDEPYDQSRVTPVNSLSFMSLPERDLKEVFLKSTVLEGGTPCVLSELQLWYGSVWQ